MLCTKQEWAEWVRDNPAARYTLINSINAYYIDPDLRDEGYYDLELKGSVTYDEMVGLYDTIHDWIGEGKFIAGKGIRPWYIVDICAGLPEDKPWIGWEIETGWRSEDDLRKATTYVRDNSMYVGYDPEGGEWAAEFTFAPRAEYMDSNHPLLMICHVAEEVARPEPHEACEFVGTHINISTPAYRKANSYDRDRVVRALNKSLTYLEYDDKEDLFGRCELYGGFSTRSESSCSGVTYRWIEGKLFNTTYDSNTARWYIEVGDNLTKLVEALAVEVVRCGDNGLDLPDYVENFYECLNEGADPVFVY